MAAVAGSGPLQNGGHARCPCRVKIGQGVKRPARTIEVACQQLARIVIEQWVQSGMVHAAKMVGYHLVVQW